MTRLKTILAALLVGACATAQAAYPDRPVKLVVAAAPGGTLDTIARLLAEHLRSRVNGNFVVENRPGASSEIASGYVAQSAPDGYTLLVNSDSLVSASLVSANDKIDPVKSFRPVSLLVSSPGVLVVNAQLGVKTLPEFIALAKRRPLNVGTTGAGTSSQFTGMMFQQRAKVTWTDVPYAGSNPAVASLIAGHVDAVWAMAAPLLPHIQSGRIVPVAVTSASPSAQLPGVAPVASVVPGFVSSNWTALFAPAGTPDAVIDVLSKGIGEMMKDKAVAARITELGFMAIGSDPQQLGEEVRGSLQRWKTVVPARDGARRN